MGKGCVVSAWGVGCVVYVWGKVVLFKRLYIHLRMYSSGFMYRDAFMVKDYIKRYQIIIISLSLQVNIHFCMYISLQLNLQALTRFHSYYS